MRVTTLRTVAVVAVVVLAGCSGVVSQGDQATPATTSTADASTANQGYSVSVVSQTSGSDDGVHFYVSDEENAIDDFAHLNVTISRVGFQRAADGDNESEGGWVERDVDNRSVDLTRLTGANATRLTTVDAPNGSYDTVFAYVSDVNGTLTDGESVRVKLPSEKLQIHKPFTVGDGESVDFVFDIAVHEAGGSGKYILKPVVGQSGTDVPMESVDEDDDDDEREGVLDVDFVENVTRGANATLEVTRNGSAVENATVTVDDERVGTTDADGRITVTVPDAEEVEISVEADDAETELELDFEREADDDDDSDEESAEGEESDGDDDSDDADEEEDSDDEATDDGDDAEDSDDEDTEAETEDEDGEGGDDEDTEDDDATETTTATDS
ncbi:DUF4382 domain-containing protein [Halobacteria archaeon HArc-gm2]|nr:DUF4382 domain-containing protein [Halobacteria archaeon HArc-gm2]